MSSTPPEDLSGPPPADFDPPPPPPLDEEPLKKVVAFTRKEVGDLDKAAVEKLDAEQLRVWELAQFQALSLEQLEWLSPAQLQVLDAKQLLLLSQEQLRALSIEQLNGLTIQQLNVSALREKLASTLSIETLESLNLSSGDARSHRQKMMQSRWKKDLEDTLFTMAPYEKDKILKHLGDEIAKLLKNNRGFESTEFNHARAAVRAQEELIAATQQALAPLEGDMKQLEKVIQAAEMYPDDYASDLKGLEEEREELAKKIVAEKVLIAKLQAKLKVLEQQVDNCKNKMAVIKGKQDFYQIIANDIQRNKPLFSRFKIVSGTKEVKEVKEKKEVKEIKEVSEGIALTSEALKKRGEIPEIESLIELLHEAHYLLRADDRYDPMVKNKFMKYLFEDNRTQEQRDFQKIFANKTGLKIADMSKIAEMSKKIATLPEKEVEDKKKKEEEIKKREEEITRLGDLLWKTVNEAVETERGILGVTTIFTTLSKLLGVPVKYIKAIASPGLSKKDYSGYDRAILQTLLTKLSEGDSKNFIDTWQALLRDPRDPLQVAAQLRLTRRELGLATDQEFTNQMVKAVFGGTMGHVMTDLELRSLINKALGFDLGHCVERRKKESFNTDPNSRKADYYHFSATGTRLMAEGASEPSGLGEGNHPLSPFEILKSVYFNNPKMTSEQFTLAMKDALENGKLTKGTIDHIINFALVRAKKPDALGGSPYSIETAIRTGKAREEADLKRRAEERAAEAKREAESRGETVVEVVVAPEGLAERVREQAQRILELEETLVRERARQVREVKVEVERKVEQEQKLRLEAQQQVELEKKLRIEVEQKAKEEALKQSGGGSGTGGGVPVINSTKPIIRGGRRL